MGGDSGPIARRLSRPVWRFRPRPPVADDPILWREMHTNRGGLIGQLIGQCLGLAVLAALAYGTFFFGSRAFAEVWRHGYTAVGTLAERPELNLVLRFFMDDSTSNMPADAYRVDFNVFLRFVTLAIMFVTSLVCGGIGLELIVTERAKDTWSSLIATSLSAREILLGKFLGRSGASHAGNAAFRALDPGSALRRDSSRGLPGSPIDSGGLDSVLRHVRPDRGHPSEGTVEGER